MHATRSQAPCHELPLHCSCIQLPSCWTVTPPPSLSVPPQNHATHSPSAAGVPPRPVAAHPPVASLPLQCAKHLGLHVGCGSRLPQMRSPRFVAAQLACGDSECCSAIRLCRECPAQPSALAWVLQPIQCIGGPFHSCAPA